MRQVKWALARAKDKINADFFLCSCDKNHTELYLINFDKINTEFFSLVSTKSHYWIFLFSFAILMPSRCYVHKLFKRKTEPDFKYTKLF